MNKETAKQINIPTQKSKNIWLIVTAVIITALVTGGGVYWWQNFLLEEAKNEINKNRQELQQLNQQITDLQTQINQLKLEEVDETSTWQTYRNEDYGFEFRYPKIYKKYEIQQTQELGIYKITQSDGLRINKQSSVEQSYLDHILCLSNNFSQSINVGNTKGMKYYLPYGYTEGDCKNIREEYPNNKPLTFIIVNVNNTSYQMTYPDSFKEEIDQILSTFKFINSTTLNTLDWQTYRNEKENFEFKYPPEFEKYINNFQGINTEISTLEEIRKEYQGWQSKGGCPGKCGALATDKSLLEKQFEILTRTAKCPPLEDFKKETDAFILFRVDYRKDGSNRIEIVYNDNFKKCGIKIIGASGYDVSLGNFYYSAGFLINGKVITMNIPLFPLSNIFEEVDQLKKEFGYKYYKEQSYSYLGCDKSCAEKERLYIENINYDNDKVIKKVVQTYDQILSTFRFIE